MLLGSAEFVEDIRHFVDVAHRHFVTEVILEPAAVFGGDVEFAVAECARAADTFHNGALLALNALVDEVIGDRTLSLVESSAFVYDDYFESGLFRDDLISRHQSADTAACNYYVVFHHTHLARINIFLGFAPCVLYHRKKILQAF